MRIVNEFRFASLTAVVLLCFFQVILQLVQYPKDDEILLAQSLEVVFPFVRTSYLVCAAELELLSYGLCCNSSFSL